MSDVHNFKEYEAETWEAGSRHSDETHHTGYSTTPRSRPPLQSRPESPKSYHQASQSGDYYRDTNITYNNSSNPNLRLGGSQLSHSNLSHQTLPRPVPLMSQYGAPQLPLTPFGGSFIGGSDHGHAHQLPIGMPPTAYPQTGSMYGMMPGGPRNTVLSGMNVFGAGDGVSQIGSIHSGAVPGHARPISTFSLATTIGQLTGPSMNAN